MAVENDHHVVRVAGRRTGSTVPQPSQVVYEVHASTGPATTCLVGCETPEGASFDRASLREGRVIFASEPLAEPLQIFGSVTADLAITSDVDSSVPLVVKVLHIDPDGRITEAAASGSGATAETVDERTRHDIDLPATDWFFTPGHRVQVAVMSGDSPTVRPSDAVGFSSIHTGEGESTFELPMIHWGRRIPAGFRTGFRSGE